MESVPPVSDLEQSLPSAIRRHFQLVRLLEAETILRSSCSKLDYASLAQRCEDFRRGFLDAIFTYRPSTKVRLIKMEFLRLWSQVAINVYRQLLSVEVSVDPAADNLVIEINQATAPAAEKSDKKNETKPLMKTEAKCLVCENSHNLNQCAKFEKMKSHEKRLFMKEYCLCFLCLQSGHTKSECRSTKSCELCGNRHATIVHDIIKVIGKAVEVKKRCPCIICGYGHMLFQCNKFGEMKPARRVDLVDRNQLCVNCLHSGHSSEQCGHPISCRHCGQRHHSLLHLAFGRPVQGK